MVTDWLFSKRKVDGVTTAIAPSVTTRTHAPANVKIVMHDGVPLLEKTSPSGRRSLHTLDGRRYGGADHATNITSEGIAP